jgi:hypothetical protein
MARDSPTIVGCIEVKVRRETARYMEFLLSSHKIDSMIRLASHLNCAAYFVLHLIDEGDRLVYVTVWADTDPEELGWKRATLRRTKPRESGVSLESDFESAWAVPRSLWRGVSEPGRAPTA